MTKYLFLIYWIAKSFYTQSSGGLQIGDYIFVLSFICFLLENSSAIMQKGGFISFVKEDQKLLVFILCVAVINGLYFILYQTTNLLLAIAYFIFNFCVVIEFRWLAKEDSFLKYFLWTNFICIATQLIIYWLGLGRWLGAVGVRYMGTFNDPNQFGFFVLSRFYIMYLLLHKKELFGRIDRILVIVAFLITAFCVIESASTGMALCLAVFMAAFLVTLFIKYTRTQKILLVLAVIIGGIVIIKIWGDKLMVSLQDTFLWDRLIEKEGKTDKGGIMAFLKERELLPLIYKPYYVLFGAGEGSFGRFSDVGGGGEMHATAISLLFYYGIIPYCILISWVVKNMKGLTKLDWCVYIGLFIEMCTLANHRQASLWILMMLPKLLLNQEKEC